LLLDLLGHPLTLGGLRALAPFAWRTARTKLESNALLALGPRDLATGQPIDVPDLLEKKGASAFRQIQPIKNKALSVLRKLLHHDTPMTTIANRFFHPRAEDFLSLVANLGRLPGAKTVLQSHGLDEQSTFEWLGMETPKRFEQVVKEFDGQTSLEAALKISTVRVEFLAKRGTFLTHEVDRFLSRKAHWTESDRPSLESLIVPDPGPADA